MLRAVQHDLVPSLSLNHETVIVVSKVELQERGIGEPGQAPLTDIGT